MNDRTDKIRSQIDLMNQRSKRYHDLINAGFTPSDDDLILRVSEKQMLEWLHKMPFFSFPKDWKVQIRPAFAGALIRFAVSKEGLEEAVSIYFDINNALGCMEDPYWEIYPDNEGNASRFAFEETDLMFEEIEKSLEVLKNHLSEPPTP